MNKNSNIFVDSDAFIALAKKDDAHHKTAVQLFKELSQGPVTFLTSRYVFSECATVISMRIGHKEAIVFIDSFASKENPFTIEHISEEVEEKAVEVFKKQSSKNTSFVDCLNIAFIQSTHIDAIFSFDDVYRKNGIPMISDIKR